MASNTVDGSMPRATEVLRIVMVGKTGAGKSASGNTILGRESFESVMSPTSITDECSKSKATVDGQDVVVIDTPGLFDTSKDRNIISRNISQCISFACPGPHVFLIVIGLGRYTKEEMETVQLIQELFGKAADRYSMVLFTRGDDLQGTIEEFIKKSQDLQELVDRCHGQYHIFNNKLKTGPQVTELLQKIRNIVEKNGGSHYTNEMFQEVERAIEEERQRILKEKEEEMRIEREQLKREIEAEFEEKLKNMKEEQLRELEKYREKQNMELVVAEEHQDRECQDREQMQNMFISLGMQNMKNNMEIKHLQEQQKLEIEKLRIEMQHREESAKMEKEVDTARWEAEKAELSKMQLERELKALQDMHQREAREKAEQKNSQQSLEATEKALQEMRLMQHFSRPCSLM